MSFDFNEARATIEAAKKRGAIREAGDTQPPTTSAPTQEDRAKAESLPDWLQTGLTAPPSDNKAGAPDWR